MSQNPRPNPNPNRMHALTRTKYGTPDVLKITEVPKPIPKDDEVLIQVHATTINRTDCAILTGKPFVMRFFTGLFKPKPIAGTDFAGQVTSIGANVTTFKIGDRVWGFDDQGLASHAQYMTRSEKKAIVKIPAQFTYAQAAASAEGAHYAYNFTNKVKLQPGQKILVNGASGAIGSALVQLLKYQGIKVTATCNTKNIDLIKSLGADKIIDYTRQDFTQDKEKYHFVFDAVGKSTFAKCKHLLLPKGAYISSELGPYSQNIFYAFFTPPLFGKKVIFPIPTNCKRTLIYINQLITAGKFKPLIDRTYPMEEAAQAYTYAASGQKTGNLILTHFVEAEGFDEVSAPGALTPPQSP